ncbi:hypothetical protein ACFYV5_34005 [Streptomyces sp. NPDC003035]|uniref:hypothetical protein n=1 Tax=Streptomyces sp. NPDC003035 TaxID=3364676 RepID=UPI0036A4CEB5
MMELLGVGARGAEWYTAHSPDLAGTARQLLADPGLQRAHVRGIDPRAERLRPAEHATHQRTFDDRDGMTRLRSPG